MRWRTFGTGTPRGGMGLCVCGFLAASSVLLVPRTASAMYPEVYGGYLAGAIDESGPTFNAAGGFAGLRFQHERPRAR